MSLAYVPRSVWKWGFLSIAALIFVVAFLIFTFACKVWSSKEFELEIYTIKIRVIAEVEKVQRTVGNVQQTVKTTQETVKNLQETYKIETAVTKNSKTAMRNDTQFTQKILLNRKELDKLLNTLEKEKSELKEANDRLQEIRNQLHNNSCKEKN